MLEEVQAQQKEQTRKELNQVHDNLAAERKDRFEYQKLFSMTQNDHTKRIRKLEDEVLQHGFAIGDNKNRLLACEQQISSLTAECQKLQHEKCSNEEM